MPKYSGLTLLELLITFSVLLLLVTLGAPALTSVQKNLQLRGAAQNSYFAFQQARSSAIAKNTPITVAIQAGENWCAAISDSGECDCRVVNQCTLDGAEYKIDHSDYRFVQLHKVTFGKQQIAVFDANRGLAIGHAGSVIFSDGDKQLKLILSNLGRVRICAIEEPLGGYPKC
ncbi:GspH/FimT family pseudopilin [Paraglaciecola aestuariivivens]